tara:strand:- start:1241 stop:3985 length:2745 start_codon:yes stop_codon:yes gene_type:complete
MNKNLSYKNMADEVASRGRYGDTTLMHVNPIEVQGLASLTPLTVNPDTGYPEAFLPLLAPIAGSLLGTAIGTGAGLSGLGLSLAGAGGSALATTAATGSVEEGLMAGLTGFAFGNALGDAASFTGASNEATRLGLDVSKADINSILGGGSDALKTVNSIGAAQPKFAYNNITNAASEAAKQPFANFDAGNVFNSLIEPSNIIPAASGLGGIAVTEDMKEFEANNLAAEEAREAKRQKILDDYSPNAPGMSGSVFASKNTPGGTQSPFNIGGNNRYDKFSTGSYASHGGQVERKYPGGYLDFNYGDFSKYFDSDGNYIGNTTGGNTTNEVTSQSSESVNPTKPNMPDISKFSLAYDPTRINMSTGEYYTDEEMQGKVRGRGLAPVPYNYMAGFMPEYQYVTNIQPTSTIGGADSSQQFEIGGSGSMGIPNVTRVGGTDVYKGSYDPNLFAGGTPYNEYLLGNVEKGIPDYLSSYMQNTPYYQYQDQVLNNIFGGGGYGTPAFMGVNLGNQNVPMPTPTPTPEDSVNPLQAEIDSLNKRIEDLMLQIEGKDSTIAEELAKDQASTFGQVTPDPKSNLIVQEGDLAGKLNIDSDIFDYLDISPEDKAGIQEYNYIPGYEYYMGSFEGDNLTEQINNYINQETANLSGLNTAVTADDVYIPQNKFDANLGAVVNEIKQEDGSYKEWAVIPNKGYVAVGSFTVDADGNKTYADKKYASGGQILNSIKTLENYTQPLPMGNMQDNLYAVGGEVVQSDSVIEINGQMVEKSEKVESVLAQPIIQEKMSEGDRDLLEKASYVILGRLKDDGSIIQDFIELFGQEAYAKLKAELLPLPQQEGMIEGEGGGMDDKVKGVIGDQEKVAVSPGEYIVPADVVGNLGDGNSEEGAKIMDDFLKRVRTEKHNTEKQPDPINLDNVMPA